MAEGAAEQAQLPLPDLAVAGGSAVAATSPGADVDPSCQAGARPVAAVAALDPATWRLAQALFAPSYTRGRPRLEPGRLYLPMPVSGGGA